MQAHLSEREYRALQKAEKVSFDVEQDRRRQMAGA
jgi:cold shock CspA family protein